jgi:aminoglycoside phosphotransferase (APT) family kinase protein
MSLQVDPSQATIDPEFAQRIARLLDAADPIFTPVTSGVSSELWRVDVGSQTYCVKRALPQLKVAGEWFAPVRRNVEEVRWLRFAADVAPRQVPAVIADDPTEGFAVLGWFDPARWTNWKTQLLQGLVRPAVGTEMGELLAALHRHSAQGSEARRSELAEAFDNMDLLSALRLEPFFVAAAAANPEVSQRLLETVEHLRSHRTALIHGDVSPKNILIHISRPPVLLDAECACWADPAFDVAFLAAHLLLKASHMASYRDWFYETIKRLIDAYEPIAPEPVGERLCLLVPALLLARVDGKSPVEYLNPKVRAKVRANALRCLLTPPASFTQLVTDWRLAFFP